jgi:hypothetical protein
MDLPSDLPVGPPIPAPSQSLLPPVRIGGFTCDPAIPESTDKTAMLRWDLEKLPDALVLREEFTGWVQPLLPTDRFFSLTRLRPGRSRYTLTTILEDPELKAQSTETRSCDVVIPGIAPLAGSMANLGSSYMRKMPEQGIAWGGVTGLAWKSPWLYFSQGDQHTVRRVHLVGGEVEEVAGMRGVPGTFRKGQDLLFQPGQLVHRRCTDDWLVLQPGANCIQAFKEGSVETTMEVLIPQKEEGKEPKLKQSMATLKLPMAMAVHPATGHVFVADAGNRMIKLFAPDGRFLLTLAEGLESGGIAVNDHGDVFYTDSGKHVVMVRRHLGGEAGFSASYAPAEIFAGTLGKAGAVDGVPTTEARFRNPMGLAMENGAPAYLLIADSGNHLVRKVQADFTPDREVETVGGFPYRVEVVTDRFAVHPNGIMAAVDANDGRINLHAEDDQSVSVIPGGLDFQPGGVALDLKGNLYFSDPSHHVVWVRRLLNPSFDMDARYGELEVFAGTLGKAGKAEGKRRTEARFHSPEGLALDEKDPQFLHITDPGNQVVWQVALELEENLPVKTLGRPARASLGARNQGLVDGPPSDAQFSYPRQLCGDGHGRIFVQDQNGTGQSPLIRVVDPLGSVATLGGGRAGAIGGQRAGSEAEFIDPASLTVDSASNIYVGDNVRRCIYKVTPGGQVSVAAGSTIPALGSDGDNGPTMEARFGVISGMGMDCLGRILAVESKLGCLRMVDFRRERLSPPEAGVSTIKSGLLDHKICTFPSSAAREKDYPFVIAEPLRGSSAFALKVHGSSQVEVLARDTKLQALCADRANRVWVVLPPDPASPGKLKIHRYSYPEARTNNTWNVEKATLLLKNLNDSSQVIDHRPYATFAPPSITAMAADSHNNIYLADSASGLIWKVDSQRFDELFTKAKEETKIKKAKELEETKEPKKPEPANVPKGEIWTAEEVEHSESFSCIISSIAGNYPYLGPLGKDLHSPLPDLKGLALTPHDDLVVTCGNAVLQITQMDTKPLRWTPKDVAIRLVPKLGPERKEPKPERARLENKDLDRKWNLCIQRASNQIKQSQNSLRGIGPVSREKKSQAKVHPNSKNHEKNADFLALQLNLAQADMAIAEAALKARNATYNLLILDEQVKISKGKAALNLADLRGIAKTEHLASQAELEYCKMQKARLYLKKEKTEKSLSDSDPRWVAMQVRLDYLKALQEARAAEAEGLARTKEFGALPSTTDPGFSEAQARCSLAMELSKQKAEILEKAKSIADQFDAKHGGRESIGKFTPWTDPPVD